MKKSHEALASETARKLVGLIALAKNEDPLILQVLGNRICEEAELLGGSNADMVFDFGDKIAQRGLEMWARKKDLERP